MKEHSDIYNSAIASNCKHSPSSDDAEVVYAKQKVRRLWIVLGLRSSLLLVELGVGFWIHSLSLLAVAGHMLSDIFTIGLALLAAWLAQHFSAGYRQVEIWAALINGLSLVAIAVLITWESVERLQAPKPVSGLPMLIVAGLSIVINGLIVHLLHEDSHHDLNLRGVFLHGLADAASSIGLILAAMAVYFFNWLWVDAAVGLLNAIFICLSAFSLAWNSLQILRHLNV